MNELKKCPYCAEDINAQAIKCKHCGEFLNKKQEHKKEATQENGATHALPAFLSLTCPGLGQLFFGRIRDGVFWFLLTLFGYIMFILPGIILHIKCVKNAYYGSSNIDYNNLLKNSSEKQKKFDLLPYLILAIFLLLIFDQTFSPDNQNNNTSARTNLNLKRMGDCNEMDAKGYKNAVMNFSLELNDQEKKDLILALGKIDSNFAIQAKAQGLKWTDDDAYKVMSSLCGKTLQQIKHVAGM